MNILKNQFNKNIKRQHLNLKNTLSNGQTFNWWQKSEDKYIGVLGNMVLQMGYDVDDNVTYQCLNKDNIDQILYSRQSQLPSNLDVIGALNTYFRLDQDLDSLIQQWSKDEYFSEVGSRITGLRLVKQEPLECLISFIVSQNNNIKRIGSNLLSIRKQYGTKYLNYEGEDYFGFPTLEQLNGAKEQDYRDMGLGYRAGYLIDAANNITQQGGYQYLLDLIGKNDSIILEELMKIKGVGKKVADCVRLFSLECNSVVPVDTHVFQIYDNKYKKSSSKKKGDTQYDTVSNLFQEKFGEFAGWAHSYLFTAELPQFQIKAVQSQSKKKRDNIVIDNLVKKIKKSK